jgi:hypothetical protein
MDQTVTYTAMSNKNAFSKKLKPYLMYVIDAKFETFRQGFKFETFRQELSQNLESKENIFPGKDLEKKKKEETAGK